MDKNPKQTAALQRLRDLAGQPEEQFRYALELLDKEHSLRVVPSALAVVAAHPAPAARPVLLRLYDYYAADGVKRDPGCEMRVAVLQALRPITQLDDRALAERALQTYEFLPPTRSESAGGLRAAGLLVLDDLDPTQAGYHAVRLLIDEHTSRMSGEPAVTAARLLAGQGELLPLYYYAVDTRPAIAEVLADCLKGLAKAPAGIVDSLIARYGDSPDDLILAGLFDLLLTHAERPAPHALLETFLRTTRRYDVYRYLVAAIVAEHQPAAHAILLTVARDERDRRKIELLVQALALVRNDPAVTALLADLMRIWWSLILSFN